MTDPSEEAIKSKREQSPISSEHSGELLITEFDGIQDDYVHRYLSNDPNKYEGDFYEQFDASL